MFQTRRLVTATTAVFVLAAGYVAADWNTGRDLYNQKRFDEAADPAVHDLSLGDRIRLQVEPPEWIAIVAVVGCDDHAVVAPNDPSHETILLEIGRDDRRNLLQ